MADSDMPTWVRCACGTVCRDYAAFLVHVIEGNREDPGIFHCPADR